MRRAGCKVDRPVRSHLFANRRGAAFLLAVYFSALALLLLGSVSLNRTTIEIRAAQVSRNVQQGFWRAEAALDDYMTRDPEQNFANGDHPARGVPGASFNVALNEAEVFNNPAQEQVVSSGKIELRIPAPYQRLIKTVVATSTDPSSGVQRNRSTVTSEGPLRGIWANGTIAVGGGAGIASSDYKFLLGDLHSKLGSVVSTIQKHPVTGKNTLMFQGLIKVTDAVLKGAWQGKLDYWEGKATPELVSIKNGYRLLHGFADENEAEAGGSYSDVRFVGSATTATTGHVTGNLSVGVSGALASVGLSGEILEEFCGSTMAVTSGAPVVIEDGFYCSGVAGATCSGNAIGLMDLDPADDHILICANAIVPKTPTDLVETLMGNPAHVIFRQPTTLLLTGSAFIDTINPVTGHGVSLPSPFSMLRTDQVRDHLGVQAAWNLTLAAMLSGTDHHNSPVPVRVFQEELGGRGTAGVVFVRPDDRFEGSLYAPRSLVVLRERACAATKSCAKPLAIQYAVGNEVVIELNADQVRLGGMLTLEDLKKGSASLQSWNTE